MISKEDSVKDPTVVFKRELASLDEDLLLKQMICYEIWQTSDGFAMVLSTDKNKELNCDEGCGGELILSFSSASWDEASKFYQEYLFGPNGLVQPKVVLFSTG